MKTFLYKIFVFCITLLFVLFIEDIITTYAFHQISTRKYGVWNDILYKDINANVIIMGNSRACNQYSPTILDSLLGTSTYNIGIDGSAFNRQYARYKIYRKNQRTSPQYIIQNVEFFTLGYTCGYEREQFMPYLMYPYFRKTICLDESFSFGELYIPMYRYYVNNGYNEFTKFDYSTQKGYFGEDISWDGNKLRNIQPHYQDINEQTLKLFINYIEETKRDGIQLVFVFAPIYIDVKSKVLNVAEIHTLFYELSKKYNIPLLDYSSCWISKDTTYFYNATHLNKKGAELFSTILAQDIDSLGIIKLQY